MESLITAYDKNMHCIYPDLNSVLSKKFHFLWNGPVATPIGTVVHKVCSCRAPSAYPYSYSSLQQPQQYCVIWDRHKRSEESGYVSYVHTISDIPFECLLDNQTRISMEVYHDVLLVHSRKYGKRAITVAFKVLQHFRQ